MTIADKPDLTSTPLSRRSLFRGAGAAGLGIVLAGSVDSLFAVPASAAGRPQVGGALGYGELVPDPMGLLDLPRGFSYKTISRAGDVLSNGKLVPGNHDGMGVFQTGGGSRVLVRNHEITNTTDNAGVTATNATTPEFVFDPVCGGGTTNVVLDRNNNLLSHEVSLAGTIRNCAGGITPWATWITCEETETITNVSGLRTPHGWNFEVDPLDAKRNTKPTPLKAMGRFAHEAIAVDPKTGAVYETEDASGPFGLLYRFVPNAPLGGHGSLREGGALSAMKVVGLEDLSLVTEPGTVLKGVTWVPVPDPEAVTTSTRRQFATTGQVTRAQKLEGAWWGGDSLFFASSYNRTRVGFPAHNGQIWKYTPQADTLELVTYISVGGRFDSPDNICVSPFGGGVMIAEDGDGEQYLVGTTVDNEPFAFAKNALNGSELAGVTFSEDNQTLYASIYTPGITFAIRGPWGARRPSA